MQNLTQYSIFHFAQPHSNLSFIRHGDRGEFEDNFEYKGFKNLTWSDLNKYEESRMNLIDTGIEKELIRFDESRSFITYIHQNKKRNYNNWGRKFRPKPFLTLALVRLSQNRIRQFVSVQMGAETKEADIIVYSDDKCEETYFGGGKKKI